MSISGNKDIDREIILLLPDKDFLSVCKINKYFWNVVCDDNLFRNRLSRTYPDTLKYNNDSYTWKDYFLFIIYYINKLKEDYDFKYKNGDPMAQYDIFVKAHTTFNIREKKEYKNYLKGTKIYNYTNLIIRSTEEGELSLLKRFAFYLPNPLFPTINKIDQDDLGTALMLACEIKNKEKEDEYYEIVKYLVEHGASIGSEELKSAAKNGSLKIVKYLVEHGSNVNISEGMSLERAAENGHLDIVKYLVEQGSVINSDALLKAKYAGHSEIVRYLIEHGCSPISFVNLSLRQAGNRKNIPERKIKDYSY